MGCGVSPEPLAWVPAPNSTPDRELCLQRHGPLKRTVPPIVRSVFQGLLREYMVATLLSIRHERTFLSPVTNSEFRSRGGNDTFIFYII